MINRNIFINLLRGHEHLYGHYWPILGVEIRKILEKSKFKAVLFLKYSNYVPSEPRGYYQYP